MKPKETITLEKDLLCQLWEFTLAWLPILASKEDADYAYSLFFQHTLLTKDNKRNLPRMRRLVKNKEIELNALLRKLRQLDRKETRKLRA